MKTLFAAFLIACSALTSVSFAAGTTDAELPNVEGPIAKVVARKKEIYVQGADAKHEFYFKPDTQLVKGESIAEFSALKEGMKVRVTYKKIGKRKEPMRVEILD